MARDHSAGPGRVVRIGDATTAIRDERARTFMRKFRDTSASGDRKRAAQAREAAATALENEKVPAHDMRPAIRWTCATTARACA